MKKTVLITIVALCVVSLVAAPALASTLNITSPGEDQEFNTNRSVDDYVSMLKDLVEADSAGDIIYPDENEVTYPFVPLKKDGEIVGYGTWVNSVIYQHAEDMIAVVSPEGIVRKWKPIDANDHHPELRKEQYLSRYYGMTLKTKFDPSVDVISGSTISSNTFFFELRNILVAFEQFGPGAE
ncbi:MAG: hypothetical protein K9K76_11810 [Halanaerobiales bacterium]|nr:hypothetical protein [Halanaerobiales bacterium]